MLREGRALLQGSAVCGRCGRKLSVYYAERHGYKPDYNCRGSELANGRSKWCVRVGGAQIEAAVADSLPVAV